MPIEIKFTTPEAAEVYGRDSNYGSIDSAGFDLRAMIPSPITILTGEQVFIATGISINLGSLGGFVGRYAAMVMPRSGRGSKEGLVLGNTVGLIDQDYLGEIMLCCWARPTDGSVFSSQNRIGGNPIHIEPFERIAQMIIVPVFRPEFVVVENLSANTARGAAGFGSTGK